MKKSVNKRRKRKSKSKKNFNPVWIGILIAVLILAVLVYGGLNDWFKSSIFVENSVVGPEGSNLDADLSNAAVDDECTLSLNDDDICLGDTTTGTLSDGAFTNCYIFGNDGSGWIPIYAGVTDSRGIWTETNTVDAVGSFLLRGLCDKNNNMIYEKDVDCITNEQSLTIIDCTPPTTPPTENGVSVGGTEGINVVIDEGLTDEIDLGDLPPTGEGPCKLQALINTDWDYSMLSKEQQLCVGFQGEEGLAFTFSDSVSQVWSRNDVAPIALGAATICGLTWDGVTPFRFTTDRILGFPDCEINLDYDIDIVTCECE